jgi:hypothetical protein
MILPMNRLGVGWLTLKTREVPDQIRLSRDNGWHRRTLWLRSSRVAVQVAVHSTFGCHLVVGIGSRRSDGSALAFSGGQVFRVGRTVWMAESGLRDAVGKRQWRVYALWVCLRARV